MYICNKDIYIYIYMYTHTHTHTHTRIYRCPARECGKRMVIQAPPHTPKGYDKTNIMTTTSTPATVARDTALNPPVRTRSCVHTHEIDQDMKDEMHVSASTGTDVILSRSRSGGTTAAVNSGGTTRAVAHDASRIVRSARVLQCVVAACYSVLQS